jgi:hypothetical protein
MSQAAIENPKLVDTSFVKIYSGFGENRFLRPEENHTFARQHYRLEDIFFDNKYHGTRC